MDEVVKPDELDNAPGYDELAAFFYARGGEKLVAEVFVGFDAEHPWFMDDLLGIAKELEARGVDKPAKVLRKLAPQFPPLPQPENPFDRDDADDRGNWVMWQQKRFNAGENKRHPFWITYISQEREKLRQSRSS
jgi:hypothetical protein